MVGSINQSNEQLIGMPIGMWLAVAYIIMKTFVLYDGKVVLKRAYIQCQHLNRNQHFQYNLS